MEWVGAVELLVLLSGGGVENITGVIGKDNGGGEDIAITGGTVVTAAIACTVDWGTVAVVAGAIAAAGYCILFNIMSYDV